MTKTTVTISKENITRKWYIIDADGVVLGRLATTLVNLLRGKGKTIYSRHVDCGDHVVVINAEKVKVTGKKETDKMYYRHSSYPGGLTVTPLEKVRKEHPVRLIQTACKKMLQNNKLNRTVLRKLKVYVGSDYREKAQRPEVLTLPKYQA